MRHVVSFSSGLSSAITAERVIARYGGCIIVFMDTTIEDDDNYRFKNEMYRRWQKIEGVEFVYLKEGRTPYQVAKDQNIIPNQKIAPCTFRLKIEPFTEWLRLQLVQDEEITIHIGYDYSEVDRCEKTKTSYESIGCNVEFPLLWKPYELRPYTQVSREDWGIEPPRMYHMGYTHANCGGMCVKQGWGDWLRTLVNFPERYARAEEWEAEMRKNPTRANYAILRDQSEGMVRPKTLRQLREEWEAEQNVGLFSLYDMEAGCVVCGVGAIDIPE